MLPSLKGCASECRWPTASDGGPKWLPKKSIMGLNSLPGIRYWWDWRIGSCRSIRDEKIVWFELECKEDKKERRDEEEEVGMMPTPSRFPISSSGSTPGYLITTSAALHLGDLIHLCSRKSHLGFNALLRSSSFKNLWRGRPPLFKGVSFFEPQNDPFSAAYSSCLCFFGGKETKKDIGSEGKSNLETPKRNLFNGRLLTNVLLAANVVVYVAQLASEGKLILWGAKINSLIDKGQFWRLVTSSLLHANIGHLMVNCYSLNSVGPTVESMSGPWRFLAVYISSAIASSTMSYWFCNAPAVGASGAIFGLVGSFAVFVLRHRGIIGDRRQSLQHVAQVIALNMVIGVLSPGIDNWGHVGGLLGGAASAWLVGPAWKYESRTNDGRSVYADRAPIFYFINKKRRMAK